MSGKKYLGVFFGKNSLSVVETEEQEPVKFFTADYNLFEQGTTGRNSPKSAPLEIKLTAILQKILREQKITSTEAGLSLPSKDVIFRSFPIPWMPANEIKQVVDFESRKYIPFKLSELSYIYHPVTIPDKINKAIRILFTAIKNDALENYCKILAEAGLRVKFIEPAPISLIRVLTFKKLIPRGQRIAVVQADESEGKIIIIEQGIPQFIRDFQLGPVVNEPEKSAQNKETAHLKLFNEVKISLDYYGRQNTRDNVSGIITLSESGEKTNEFSESFGKELGIPVTTLDAKSILNKQSVNTIDLLNAYGMGLRNTAPLAVNFDLQRKIEGRPTEESGSQEITPINYRSFAKVAVICLVLIAAAFGLSNLSIEEQKKKLESFKKQAGIFQDSSEDALEKKVQEINKKQDVYKSVPLKSDVTFFLNIIPRFLPQGAWLKELTINFFPGSTDSTNPSRSGEFRAISSQPQKEKQVKINMTGYAFVENTNQQLRLVKNLISNMKNNKEFMRFFKNVSFTTETTELNGYPVTYFKINCE